MNPAEADALTLGVVTDSVVKKEMDLFEGKWFDNQLLHPLEATSQFALAYRQAVKNFYRKAIDSELSEFKQGFSGETYLDAKKGTQTGLWKARQHADILGMPYDTFCNFAMDFCIICGMKTFPFPNQLYSETILTYIGVKWEEEKAARIVYPKSPYFLAENFVACHFQMRFQMFLIKRLKAMVPGRRLPALASALYISKHLVRSVAEQHFGANELGKADGFCVFRE